MAGSYYHVCFTLQDELLSNHGWSCLWVLCEAYLLCWQRKRVVSIIATILIVMGSKIQYSARNGDSST